MTTSSKHRPSLFCVIENEGPVLMADLKEKRCRFPVDGVLFCGAESAKGKPYCEDHCERAYLKSRKSISVPSGV